MRTVLVNTLGHSQNVCVIGVALHSKRYETRLKKTVEVCNVLLISDVHCFEKHPHKTLSSGTFVVGDVVIGAKRSRQKERQVVASLTDLVHRPPRFQFHDK